MRKTLENSKACGKLRDANLPKNCRREPYGKIATHSQNFRLWNEKAAGIRRLRCEAAKPLGLILAAMAPQISFTQSPRPRVAVSMGVWRGRAPWRSLRFTTISNFVG